MLFVIHAIDAPNSAEFRQQHYPQHFVHLDRANEQGIRIEMSGPLVADDGKTVVGSMLVVEAQDRSVVERFYQADPFVAVWQSVRVDAFLRRR